MTLVFFLLACLAYLAVGFGFLILSYAALGEHLIDGEQYILVIGWPLVVLVVGVYKGCLLLDKWAKRLGTKVKEKYNERSSDS